MSDQDVRVGIVADASGLNAVNAGIQTTSSRLDELRARLAVATAELRTHARALNEAAAAAQQAGSGANMSAVTAAAGAFATSKAQVTSLTEELKKLEGGLHGVSLASAGATRELIVLAHEMLQGNYSRFGGSLMVLAERMRGLEQITAALAGPWGVVAIAGVAALGAITYAAYQTVEGILAVRDATDRLVQAGSNFEAAESAAKHLRQTLSNEFHETNGEIRSMVRELDKLPAEALGSREALAKLAEGMSAFNHQKPSENLNEVVGAAKNGPQAFLKFADEIYHLSGAFADNGVLLKDHVSILVGAHKEGEAFEAILKAISKAAGGQAEEAQKATNAWREWAKVIASLGAEGVGPPVGFPGFLPTPDFPKRPGEYQRPGGPEPAPIVTEGNRIASDLTRETRKRLEIQTQLNTMVEAEEALRGELEGARMAGNDAGADNLIKQIQRLEEARKNLEVAASKVTGSGEEHEFEAEKARLEGLVQEHKSAVDRIIADRERLYYLQFNRVRDREIAAGMSPENAEAFARGDPSVISKANQWQQAVRAAEEQALQLRVGAEREAAEAARRGAEERVAAEKRVLAIIEQARDQGLKSDVDVATQKRVVARVEREATDQAYHDFKEKKLQEVAEAKGAADKIIAIYDQIAAAAKRMNQPDSELTRLRIDQVRALQHAEEEAFRATEASMSAEQRLADMRLKANDAILKQRVAAHLMSTQEQIAAEQQLTAAIYAQLEARVQKELENQNLTKEQRARLNDQLAELYMKDADKQLEAQQKITQAIEAENKRRTAALSSMFDSMGSTFEQAIIGRLTGKPMQWTDFVRSMVGDVVKAGGSILSQVAGKALAPTLGVKLAEGEDSALGNVLGRAVGDMLGLTKKTDPGATMADASSKMQKAVDAAQTAADIQKEAANTFSSAVDRFKAGGGGAGGSAGSGKRGYDLSSAGEGFQPSGGMSYDEIHALAVKAGFQGKSADTATAIALAESSGNPKSHNAVYPDDSYGLMQINALAHGPIAKEALDPQRSMELAFDISKGGTNFSPWTTYTKGTYRKYLRGGSADAGDISSPGGGITVDGVHYNSVRDWNLAMDRKAVENEQSMLPSHNGFGGSGSSLGNLDDFGAGGDPEAAGMAAMSQAMQPAVDAMVDKLGEHREAWFKNAAETQERLAGKSLYERATDPEAFSQAMDVALGAGPGAMKSVSETMAEQAARVWSASSANVGILDSGTFFQRKAAEMQTYNIGGNRVPGTNTIGDPYAGIVTTPEAYNLGGHLIPADARLKDFGEMSFGDWLKSREELGGDLAGGGNWRKLVGSAAIGGGLGAGGLVAGGAFDQVSKSNQDLTATVKENISTEKALETATDNDRTATQRNTDSDQRVAQATDQNAQATAAQTQQAQTQTQATSEQTTATSEQTSSTKANTDELSTTKQSIDKLSTATEQNTQAAKSSGGAAKAGGASGSGPDIGDKFMSGLSSLAGLGSAISALTGGKSSPLLSGGLGLISALSGMFSKNGLFGSEGLFGNPFGFGKKGSGGGLFSGLFGSHEDAGGQALKGLTDSARTAATSLSQAGNNAAQMGGSLLTSGTQATTMGLGLTQAGTQATIAGTGMTTAATGANAAGVAMPIAGAGANVAAAGMTTAGTSAVTAGTEFQAAGAQAMAGGAVGGGGGIFGTLFSGIGALLALENGGIIPSAANGMIVESSLPSGIRDGLRAMATGTINDGKGGRLAINHPGEMVVPAYETGLLLHGIASMDGGGIVGGISGTSVRRASLGTFGAPVGGAGGDGAGGGGDSFHFSISALDAHSVARLLMNHGPTIVRSFNKAVRNGTQVRPLS